MLPAGLLLLLDSGHRIYLVPDFEPHGMFFISIAIHGSSGILGTAQLPFYEAGRLLAEAKARGYTTQHVSAQGIILERDA